MRYPITTEQVASLAREPASVIQNLIRGGYIGRPEVRAGRRLWSQEHAQAAVRAVKAWRKRKAK